ENGLDVRDNIREIKDLYGTSSRLEDVVKAAYSFESAYKTPQGVVTGKYYKNDYMRYVFGMCANKLDYEKTSYYNERNLVFVVSEGWYETFKDDYAKTPKEFKKELMNELNLNEEQIMLDPIIKESMIKNGPFLAQLKMFFNF